MLPIVDTHQHLWDLTQFRLPWVGTEGPMARSYRMEDYLRATEGLNIVKTVYMEVDVDPAQQAAEAEYVTDVCRADGNPMVGAVISGRPESKDFAAYIARFSERPEIKGVRRVLHGGTPAGYCLTPTFVESVCLLGRHSLSFDLCMRAGEIVDGAKLADLCPETQFILDHCGNPKVQATDRSEWERDIAEVAQRPNVVCKISGILASARPYAWTPDDLAPIVLRCAEVFGPNRILFGGDWPVCTLGGELRQWVEALQEIVRDWPETDRRKLFSENAERVYRV